MRSSGRRVTVGVEHPLRLSLTLRQSETGQSCPAGDRGDGGDSRFGIPPPLSPFGRTPRKRGVQAWAFPASFGASSHPCGQKNRPRFFRPAFTGCNTLHLACKVVCQTFPLDSLYRAYALRYPPLHASDNGVTVTAVFLSGGIPEQPSSPSPP